MINLKTSELVIHNIVTINHSVETIFFKNEHDKVSFNDHIINCEFDKHEDIDNNKMFRIVFNIEIVPPEGHPGYKIQSEIHGYYQLDPDVDIDETKKSGFDNTALAIIISYLRAHLRNITFEGIYGAYTMPSVDFVDLLKKKNLEVDNQADNIELEENQ